MVRENPLQSVLFVCTGNIFRSLVAEYALKRMLQTWVVGSAGIEAKPQVVHEWVQARLKAKGADATLHVQRRLSQKLIEETDLIIAMASSHQAFIREQYGREVPLFNFLCFERNDSILDLHEAMPEWEKDLESARRYVWSVIDQIWDAAPILATRLAQFR